MVKLRNGSILCTIRSSSVAGSANVRETIDALIAEGADTAVAPATRAAVEAVVAIYERTSTPVTVKQVDEVLGIGKQAAQNRIRRAVGHGWLTDERARAGGKWLVKPGDVMPDSAGSFLPSVGRLRALASGEDDPEATPPKGNAEGNAGALPSDLAKATGLQAQGNGATGATSPQGRQQTTALQLDLGTASMDELRAEYEDAK